MADTLLQESSSQPDQPLYRRVSDRVAGLIAGGTLAPGERIPSVRRLSRQLSVSVTTVLEAYRLLEDRGLVEARPQSGYYVRQAAPPGPEPAKTESALRSAAPLGTDLVLEVVRQVGRSGLVPLGSAAPSAAFLPVERLNRTLARVVRVHPDTSWSYDSVAGHRELRVQIARRAFEAGCSLTPEDVVTTCGAQQAVSLALRATARPGDTVAVETPTFHGLLQAIEWQNLRAIEVATDPRTGIVIEELQAVLRRQDVAVVVVGASFGNPLGHSMPEDRRKALVAMLAEADVPLIEDDVYGELPLDGPRPPACKAFDRTGNVLLCSSFSKTIAPGYRVGWVVPGRHHEAVVRAKFAAGIASPTPTQMALAEFLAGGGFDRHLGRLRRTYRDLRCRMTCAIQEWFPEGTRVTRPAGGHVLWIEMDPRVDAVALYRDALAAGISILPGPLFSPTGRYGNFIRVNFGVPWSGTIEAAVKELGRLAARRAAAPGA